MQQTKIVGIKGFAFAQRYQKVGVNHQKLADEEQQERN
jgi:hypothetical protein